MTATPRSVKHMATPSCFARAALGITGCLAVLAVVVRLPVGRMSFRITVRAVRAELFGINGERNGHTKIQHAG